jgi:hypothetical protein
MSSFNTKLKYQQQIVPQSNQPLHLIAGTYYLFETTHDRYLGIFQYHEIPQPGIEEEGIIFLITSVWNRTTRLMEQLSDPSLYRIYDHQIAYIKMYINNSLNTREIRNPELLKLNVIKHYGGFRNKSSRKKWWRMMKLKNFKKKINETRRRRTRRN